MAGALDSNQWKRGIVAALQIKDSEEAPNAINTDEVQYTVDAVQGGFSAYEIKTVSFSAIPIVNQSFEVVILDPNDFEEDDPRNNRLYEYRLLGAKVRISAMLSIAGEEIDCRLQITEKSAGVPINFIFFQQPEIAGITSYTWAFPSMVTQATGQFQAYQINSWQGWIPAGLRFAVQLRRQTPFTAAESVGYDFTFIRVPRFSQLPI